MPRIARIVAVGHPHHITQRGNYKQNVFFENIDYIRYLKWLNKYSNKYKLSVLAYSLIPNHVHSIAVPANENSLSKTFHTCHMRYAQYFHKKNDLRGHLWQGRFYSCALDEKHLYAAIRYVENNPVRAKLVSEAEDWEWSSARYHLNKGNDKGNSLLSLADINNFIDVEDWERYLSDEDDETIIASIRSNTLAGRPSGDDTFVSQLEETFGKRLKLLPVGRPRSANRK